MSNSSTGISFIYPRNPHILNVCEVSGKASWKSTLSCSLARSSVPPLSPTRTFTLQDSHPLSKAWEKLEAQVRQILKERRISATVWPCRRRQKENKVEGQEDATILMYARRTLGSDWEGDLKRIAELCDLYVPDVLFEIWDLDVPDFDLMFKGRGEAGMPRPSIPRQ